MIIFPITAIILITAIHFAVPPLVGLFAVCFFIALNGYAVGEGIIASAFRISQKFIRWALGSFLVFNAVAFFVGIFIVFYKFTPFILDGIILAVSALSFISYSVFCKDNFYYSIFRDIRALVFGFKNIALRVASFHSRSYKAPVFIGFAFLFAIGFWTLISRAAPNSFIKTPWAVIPGEFAWVLAVISATLFGMIFFRPRPALLVGIVLFSFLQHAYIPAVYRMPYGLDDWRHIGMMEKIEDTGAIAPYIITPRTDWTSIGGIKFPTALVSGSKTSYAAFWAGALFLRKALHINFVKLTVWWQYGFFSLFAPILLYALFHALARLSSRSSAPKDDAAPAESRERLPLAAALLSAAFYPMQLYGGISLPVGFHFLFFLFFLLTVVLWMSRPSKICAMLLACEFVLMFFGYIVYWLIAILIIGFLIVEGATRGYEMSVAKKSIRLLYLFASVCFIPIVSLRASPNARFDILTTSMEYFGDFWKHTAQSVLGFKPIGSPRPQAGNLIWHDMRITGADTALFKFQYTDTILLVLFIALFTAGLYAVTRTVRLKEQSRVFSFALYIFAVSLFSIFLDLYYFGGIHLLTERMDLIFDVGFIIIAVFGIEWILKRRATPLLAKDGTGEVRSPLLAKDGLVEVRSPLLAKEGPGEVRFRRLLEVLTKAVLAIFLGLVIGSTSASGPVYGRATSGEFQAMQKVYSDMQSRGFAPLLAKDGLVEVRSPLLAKDGLVEVRSPFLAKEGPGEVPKYCVLAEEFTVAAMEAASRGRVVNGNFSIQYGYLEDRGKLFVKMFSKPDIRWMKEAKRASGARGCYLVLDKRFLADWNLQQIRWILGREFARVDGVYVWRYDGEKK